MRVILYTIGSTGDRRPFLALAKELQRSGHQPVMALSPDAQQSVEQAGLEFAPVGVSLEQLVREAICKATDNNQTQQQLYEVELNIGRFLSYALKDLRRLCSNADLLVAPAIIPIGPILHELTSIPYVSVLLPYPGSALLGGQQTSMIGFNRVRRSLGLGPACVDQRYPLTGASADLMLVAISRHLIGPHSWPSQYQPTGFFYLESEPYEPPAALQSFLAAGDPPVVVSFGSMLSNDMAMIARLILEALQRVGCRAIVQQGWGQLLDERVDLDHVYVADFIPHAWLFAQTTCVIHHSGIGTAAETLRSGVPSIPVPFAYDQPEVAGFLRRIGCAPDVIPYQRLTSERLACAIDAALTERRYWEVAQEIQPKVIAEQGVRQACEALEHFVSMASLS